MMKGISKIVFALFFVFTGFMSFAQEVVEHYEPARRDSLRVGSGQKDLLPFIEKGYTLMLPESKVIRGVLIFLEDSVYDEKNRSARQLYEDANEKSFAVLSVSSEIPLDFYFSERSMLSTSTLIQTVFERYQLPNEHVFFLGASLTGHRAMRFVKFMKENSSSYQLSLRGLVICNFTLDFSRKWYQHKRDIRINRIDLREPRFINFMLESHLGGTPETKPEAYHDFSSYSYFDERNRNISMYKEYAILAYIEPAIKYKLSHQLRTLYENNSTDIVGFLAELELAGNVNTELIVIQSDELSSRSKSAQSTWDEINKDQLMSWIEGQLEN